MVGMNVRNDDDVDSCVIDVECFHSCQRSGSEINCISQPGNIDDEAGIESAILTKGVAGPGECHVIRHDLSPITSMQY